MNIRLVNRQYINHKYDTYTLVSMTVVLYGSPVNVFIARIYVTVNNYYL